MGAWLEADLSLPSTSLVSKAKRTPKEIVAAVNIASSKGGVIITFTQQNGNIIIIFNNKKRKE